MKGISDQHEWSDALNQLRRGRKNVAGEEDDAFRVLRFSYDWLKSTKIQHCFLYCALYPEDHKFPKEELIEYWIAEELIDVMQQTRQEMKDEGHAILNKLEENCLLEFTRDWRSKSECVRMHDLVRDMAIDITRSSSHRFLVKAGMGLSELPEEHEWKKDLSKVSLMSNHIQDIPSSMPSPRCPALTTLLLSDNNISTIPELFFEHMPKLEVLDLSYNRQLRSLPSSVSNLVKLTTLLLRECKSLKEVPSLSDLTALKKLDLFEAGLEEVPHGLKMLLNLKYLDIRNRSRKNTAEWIRLVSEILSNLSKLQHLVLDPRVPVEGGQLGGIWPELESFCGSFRTWRDMSIFLNKRQKRLYDYNIYAGDPNNARLYLGELKCIRCYDCGEPGLIPSDVERLSIRGCNDVRSLDDISRFRLLKLKKLELRDLKNLKGLSDSLATVLE